MTGNDFESLADQIAESLIKDGTSLSDGVLQKANSMELKPEQIKRLVEFTNRAAFQKYYKEHLHKLFLVLGTKYPPLIYSLVYFQRIIHMPNIYVNSTA